MTGLKHLSKFLMIYALFSSCSALSFDVMEDLENDILFLSERDKVLSQNIANIDTPEYKPKDISMQKSDNSFRMYSTHENHIAGSENDSFEEFESEIKEVKPNGNSVTLEDEMKKKSEVSMQLSKVLNIQNRIKAMIKSSLKGE